MAAPALTYASLRQSIKNRRLAPMYLLHGEEGYYIDELAKLFESLIPEQERDFNLYVMYGPETEPDRVIEACRRYPMMADFQVVILKEAQAMRSDALNKLASYAAGPNKSTVLVICCRGAQAKAKDLISRMRTNGGIIFESPKLKENTIAPLIEGLIKEKGLNIEAKGLTMLRDYIGLDLSRMYNEIEKLALILGPGSMVTPESIERNIGISKDYNNFELIDAIASRNAEKVFRITGYFRSNPKNNPTVMTVSTLFNYFANLLTAQFTKDKSPASLMNALGLRWQSQLKGYEIGLRNYNAYQSIEIISAIRAFDAMSKGVGSRQPEFDLLHDLMFRILTARGVITI